MILSNNRLYFLCGLPRSGKTTASQKWLASNDHRTIISGDEVRLAMTGERYFHELEPHVYAHIITSIRYRLKFEELLYDDTNTSIFSLYSLFRIDQNAQPIIIDTKKEIRVGRAIALGQDYLIPVIEKCHKNMRFLMTIGGGTGWSISLLNNGINKIRGLVQEGYTLNDIFTYFYKGF